MTQLSTASFPAWAIGPCIRPVDKAVIEPNPNSVFHCPLRCQPVHWEALHTFNPAAVVHDGKICVLYRAEDDTGEMRIGLHTSRLGLAESTDGVHFTRHATPVFYPEVDSEQDREWEGGCEDPRVVEGEDGTFVLTYTQWNRRIFRVGIATSRDLVHWTKHGHAFAGASGGKYDGLHYKSAGIVTRVVDGRLVAARINGRFTMYWGEGQVHLATSDDLVHWQPLEDGQGHPLVLLAARPGKFDSDFPEVGPPPLLTDNGIVVMYNGKNNPQHGDPHLGPNAYAAGQALFDPRDPTRLIARLDEPCFKPEMPFEKTGQYAAGTTFVEGLVLFKGQWFLYYGCADSKVGVAVAEVGRLSMMAK